MKFSVNAQEMKAAMSLVNKAISGKNTLPIMSCVKLEQDAYGNLTLTGGSEGTFMTLTVPMFEVQDFHPVCIEAAILSDTLGTLGKQNATFQVDGTSATLVYSTGHFNFAVQSTDEYPTVQDNIEAVDAFTMTATDFSKMISTCRAYTIDDELRPVMGGVYLDLTKDHLVMAASDGHRMIRKAFPDVKAGGKIGCIVTGQTASLLATYQKPVDMTVRLNERQTVFFAEGFRLVATNINGNYPNYNSVIPNNNPIRVEVDRSTLAQALKRSLTMCHKATALVKLSLSTYMGGAGQMGISSSNIEFGQSAEETIPCTHNHDNPFAIGFKGTFLLDLLTTHTTPQVVFELADPSRAMVVRDAEGGDKDLLTLLMPMMLQD